MIFHVFPAIYRTIETIDPAKLLDVHTLLSESHAMLLYVIWYVTSLSQNHATCSYMLMGICANRKMFIYRLVICK